MSIIQGGRSTTKMAVEAAQIVHPLANSDFAGWLTKEGSLVKSWKRRFFVVKGTDLFYYSTEPVGEKPIDPVGVISLQNGSIDVIGTKKNHDFCFAIKTPDRKLVCSADDAEAMEEWIETLRMSLSSTSGLDEEWQKHPDFSGFLTKKGSHAPTWKRRWFILKGSNLFYFRNEPGPLNLDMKPLGVLSLDHAVVEEASPGSGKSNAFYFVISSPQRKLEVHTDSIENREAWIAALRSASALVGGGLDWHTDAEWSGFLYKKGANNPGWKRRWFALRGHLLYYFKAIPVEGESAEPRGVINTKSGSVDERNDLGRDFGFAIVQRNPLRTYFLAADSIQERYDWMSQILLSLCRE